MYVDPLRGCGISSASVDGAGAGEFVVTHPATTITTQSRTFTRDLRQTSGPDTNASANPRSFVAAATLLHSTCDLDPKYQIDPIISRCHHFAPFVKPAIGPSGPVRFPTIDLVAVGWAPHRLAPNPFSILSIPMPRGTGPRSQPAQARPLSRQRRP